MIYVVKLAIFALYHELWFSSGQHYLGAKPIFMCMDMCPSCVIVSRAKTKCVRLEITAYV